MMGLGEIDLQRKAPKPLTGLTKTGGVISNSHPFAYLESLLTLCNYWYFEIELVWVNTSQTLSRE